MMKTQKMKMIMNSIIKLKTHKGEIIMIVNKENLMKIIEDVEACAFSYVRGNKKYLTNNGDVIHIVGFVYEPIYEYFDTSYELYLNDTLLYELNGSNGIEKISGVFKNEDEAISFLENYFKEREVEVSDKNPIPNEEKIVKVFKDIDSTVLITKAPNDKYFNYYYDLQNSDHHTSNAGSFNTLEEAEDMVYKHRPNVKEIKIKNEEEKTMNNLNVKVEFKEVNKENSNLKGFADITLAGVTVKNVAIKEIQTKKGTLITFDAPNIDKYEDKEGAMHYIKSVTFNEDKQGLMTEIRKAIIEAINSTETNEYGKKVVTHETKIEYDKDFVKSYVRPLTFENNPYLKAQSKVYVGGVLSINNVNLAQGVSKDGKDFEAINFPETKVEKDGNTSYKPLVYADKELMPKIKDSVISEYNKEQEQNKSEEESEEDEI